MLARVDGAEAFAVHRTYLARPGRAVAPRKAMLGPCRGGAVRLAAPGSAMPSLAIAERCGAYREAGPIGTAPYGGAADGTGPYSGAGRGGSGAAQRPGGARLGLGYGPAPLVVTEGIENGLSLLCGILEGPAHVWAALSTSGLKALTLPREPGELVIAGDGDGPGQAAAAVLSRRATGLGWRVRHLDPPEGRDWNDVLRGQRAAAGVAS